MPDWPATGDVTSTNPSGGTAVWPGLVCPYLPSLTDGASGHVAGTIYGCRVIVPKTGTLHDIAVEPHAISGNLRVGVYDTGDASSGNRSRLYDSGSVAAANAGHWSVIGDPALSVQAGQQLDLVVMVDNATITLMRKSITDVSQVILPTSFLAAAGGASPKLNWGFAAGAYAAFPSTITEAQCGTDGNVRCLIARVD